MHAHRRDHGAHGKQAAGHGVFLGPLGQGEGRHIHVQHAVPGNDVLGTGSARDGGAEEDDHKDKADDTDHDEAADHGQHSLDKFLHYFTS